MLCGSWPHPLESVAPVLVEVPQLPRHLPESLPPLGFRLRVDQVGQALHLTTTIYTSMIYQ